MTMSAAPAAATGTSKKQPPAAAAITPASVAKKEEELDVNAMAGHVKGYKKTSDGRKTTFFNNEMTNEVRELIGDIAPKRIDNPDSVKIQNVQGGSAWNQGTTFEEKNVTSWAKDKLESLLKELEYVNESNGPEATTVIKVKSMSAIEGDASLAVMRGKKRYLFDFTFSLTLVATFGDEPEEEGKVSFLDVSSDCNDDYDVDLEVKNRYKNSGGKQLYDQLSNPISDLRKLITQQLVSFRKEFESL